KPPTGLYDFKRVGLLVKTMRRNRIRRAAALWIHRLENEMVFAQVRHDGVAAAGLGSKGGTLDDLRHVHCQPLVVAAKDRQRREYGCVASAPRDHHVGAPLQRSDKWLYTHLSYQPFGLEQALGRDLRNRAARPNQAGLELVDH